MPQITITPVEAIAAGFISAVEGAQQREANLDQIEAAIRGTVIEARLVPLARALLARFAADPTIAVEAE